MPAARYYRVTVRVHGAIPETVLARAGSEAEAAARAWREYQQPRFGARPEFEARELPLGGTKHD